MFFYVSDSSPFVRFFIQKINHSKRSKQKTCQVKKVNRKGVISLQTDHTFSVILHNSIQACRRISFCLFSKRCAKKEKASMTIEAALVLPLFVFAVMNLMSFIEIYREQSNRNMSLHETVKEMAVLGAATKITGEDECIDIVYPYRVEPYAAVVGFSDFLMFSRMRTRAWTGYDNEAAQPDEEDKVYVTEYGEVYHYSKSCAYLKLSIRAVDLDYIEKLRNADGSCYYACEECGRKCTSTVFVTSYGNRYHATLQCSGLKRTIQEIPLSQVGSRTACKKCG